MADQQDIVQSGKNGKCKHGAKKGYTGQPNPPRGMDFQQQDKKDGSDLSEGVCFSKDARAEVAQSGGDVQYRAYRKNTNVAAEYEHGEFPWNFMEDREHQKNCAQ